MAMPSRPIGVFDSGVGGVSVLREMVNVLPRERFIYYGDNLNAPYGVLEEDKIRALAMDVARRLMRRDIKALVIACNTATSAAAETMRAQLPIPVVGIEPALKPAALNHDKGAILVLATPATLRQQKFHNLMEHYGRDAVMVPCDGLMEFVERGELDGPGLDAYLDERLGQWRGRAVEAVVLGCTHYVFLKDALRRALPGARLYDGNRGTANRLKAVLEEKNLLRGEGQGSVQWHTSGDEAVFLPIMRMLFNARMDFGEDT